MSDELTERTIAILATDGVEQVELTAPREAVEDAGGRAVLVVPGGSRIQAYHHDVEPGETFEADRDLANCDAADFDGLILPGGTTNPDRLRLLPEAADFVRGFTDAGTPVAAICHGPWMLVEADVLRGKTLTSYPSLRTDVRNAGGSWRDAEVQVCGTNDWTLVTSRRPDDLPAFTEAMVEAFAGVAR
ncbi:type 1 glutamine amidotransferase domain-containing protein [Nocardioides insulae]|uniref:type 1 glutamine amidotransferase domain-containing protein n=1 Tax=Nocardioides insulae TaxID=394734 RepID=UPI00041393E6|nr:type 1 glutamine amidotransferase domain-containing protein [Nocardioides insulae]